MAARSASSPSWSRAGSSRSRPRRRSRSRRPPRPWRQQSGAAPAERSCFAPDGGEDVAPPGIEWRPRWSTTAPYGRAGLRPDQEQPARGALLRAAGMDLGGPPDVLPRARRRRYPIPAEPVRGRRRSGAAGTWREWAAELAVTADGNRTKQIMQRQGGPLLLFARIAGAPLDQRSTSAIRPLRLRSELDEDACFQRESESKESPRAFRLGHHVESGQRAGDHPLSSALGCELTAPRLSG